MNLAKYTWMLFSFLLLASKWLPGQSHRLALSSLQDELALSQISVYDIFQDSRGFLWFGTEDGLNRYDGYELKVHTVGPRGKGNLESGWISAIREDRKGRLLIGTKHGGLSVLDWATETLVTHRHDPAQRNSLSHDRVNSIILSEEGAIWIATGSGVDLWQTEALSFAHYPLGETNTLYFGPLGALYAGGQNGLFEYNSDGNMFAPLPLMNSQLKTVALSPITCMAAHESTSLWLGTRKDGLLQIDPKSGRILRQLRNSSSAEGLNSDFVSALLPKKPDQLWVGTRNAGLAIISLNEGTIRRHSHDNRDRTSLINDGVNCLYSDESGLVWIGTDLGVNMYDARKTVFHHLLKRNELIERKDTNMTWAVLRPSFSDSELLVGTNRGLWVVQHESNALPKARPRKIMPHSLGQSRIFSLTEDRERSIWIGSNEGLIRYWPDLQKMEAFGHHADNYDGIGPGIISDIVTDREGRIWAGTFSGSLFRFDPKSRRCDLRQDRAKDSDMVINALLFSQDWQLFAATNRGLAKIAAHTTTMGRKGIELNPVPGPLGDHFISCMLEDRFGLFWVGTANGLYKWDRKRDTVRLYTRSDGLPNTFISGILEEPDRQGQPAALWVSTNLGLSRLDIKKEEFSSFDSQDGLQANEFNGNACFRAADGELFFAGINGISAFHPWSIRKKGLPSKMTLTGIFVGDRPATIGREIHGAPSQVQDIFLTYRDASISLKASVLDFRTPGKNRLSYFINGVSENWVDLEKERIIRYPGLSPGTHQIRIRGFNSEGIPCLSDRLLHIHVSPPLWRTWWAYLLYGILLLILLMSLHWLRISNLKKRKEDLAEQVRIRTRDLAVANESLTAANLEISLINEELSQSMGALARANDQLKKANQLKSDFLGIAVHDLSNPLQVIIGTVEMLEDKAREESLDMPELEFINSAAEKMLQLINRLLETARQDQSEIELFRTNMDLSKLVWDVIESRTPMASRKRQELETDIADNVMANGDALLISQVIENLLSNAIKYSPPGKTIYVSLEVSDNQAHFGVRDQGPGLTEEDQKQLFTRFRRLSARPTGGESANGLGLSFCKRFIEAHGGKMEVTSVVNQGSTFGFRLPLHQK